MSRIRIALGLSLAANLVLVGWIAGTWLRAPRFPPPLLAERLAGRLSPEGQTATRDLISQIDTTMQATFAQMDGRRGDLMALAGATRFDRSAFADALRQNNLSRSTLDTEIDRTLPDLLERLSPQDRLTFARTIFQRPGDDAPPPPH